jgi:ribosome biogenesis protein Tsr3
MEQLEIVDVNWDQQERCEMVGREHRMAPYLLRNPFLTCQGIVFRSGCIIIP